MKIRVCEPTELSSKSLKHKDFIAAFKAKTAKDLSGVTKSAPVDYFIQVNHTFSDKAKKKLAFAAIGTQSSGWTNLLKELKKSNKKNISIGKCYIETDEKGTDCLCLMHQEGGAKKGTIMKQIGKVAGLGKMSLRVVGAEEGDDPEANDDDDDDDDDDDADKAAAASKQASDKNTQKTPNIAPQLEEKKKAINQHLSNLQKVGPQILRGEITDDIKAKVAELQKQVNELDTLLASANDNQRTVYKATQTSAKEFFTFWDKASQNATKAAPSSKNVSEMEEFLGKLLAAMKIVSDNIKPLLDKKQALNDKQIGQLKGTLDALKKAAEKYAKLSAEEQQKVQANYKKANPEENVAKFEKMLEGVSSQPKTQSQPNPEAAKRREQAMARVAQIRQRLSEIAQELSAAQ
jgi:archaellum component FlaC